jgi:hypothetical protein
MVAKAWRVFQPLLPPPLAVSVPSTDVAAAIAIVPYSLNRVANCAISVVLQYYYYYHYSPTTAAPVIAAHRVPATVLPASPRHLVAS